jgi:hypothetical protein
MIKRIISGGQTGAERAALDVSIEFGIPHGGWIPKGRKTEEGPLPEKYRLKEMPTGGYQQRTHQNVIDSHGTTDMQIVDDSASAVIIRELWKNLKKSHRLRILK